MKILKDITIESYLNLLNSENKTFRKYYSEDMDFDSDEYRSLFTDEELILDILGIEDSNAPELIISNDARYDFENSKRIFDWLKKLSIADANDWRFWTTLTHLTYEKYTRVRWKIDKKTTNETIKQRYFYSGAGLQSRLRNSLSRLWWISKLTVREDLPDKYVYTDVVWSSQDLMQNIFERSLGTYPNIRFGILKFYLQRKGTYDSKQFRVFYKEINALGATSPLGLLSEDEVVDFLIKVEKAYYSNLISEKDLLSNNESKNLNSRNSKNNDLKEIKSDLILTEEECSIEKDYQQSDVEEFMLSDSNDSNEDFSINPEVYVKKVNLQDLERTPSISARAITDFFKINLLNGQIIDLPCQYKGKEIFLKLKKRETRDEYRLFINKFRVEIGYNLNDLLVFRFKSEKLHLDILKETFNISQNPRYNYYNSKLGKNFHLLL
jgi:hypothetical protein